MTDVTFSGGGQRESRSRRTRATGAVTGQTRVRTQATSREVGATGQGVGRAQSNLAGALSSFFPALQQFQQNAKDDALVEVERDVADAITEVNARVAQDPEGARLAIQEGRSEDFMGLTTSQRIKRSRVLNDHLEAQVFSVNASRDFVTDLADRISQTPIDGDPFQTVDDFITEQTKGASPIAAQAYAEAIGPRALEAATKHQVKQLERRNAKIYDTARENIRRDIVDGNVDLTREGLQNLKFNARGLVAIEGLQGDLLAESVVQETLLNMASQGNLQAQRLMEITDPDNDGLSVAMRRPEDFQRAVALGDKIRSDQRKARAKSSLDEIRIGIGQLGDSMTAQEAAVFHTMLIDHADTFGITDGWQGAVNAVNSVIEKEGVKVDALSDIMAGRTPVLGDANSSAVSYDLFHAGLPADQRTAVDSFLGSNGSGTKLRSETSSILLSSQDEEQVRERFARLQALMATNPTAEVGGFHVTEDAADLANYMLWAAESGTMDPLTARQEFRNNNDGSDPTDYLRGVDKTPGKKHTVADVTTLAQAASRTAQPGLLERLLPGESGALAWNDMDTSLQEAWMEAVNVASWQLKGQNPSQDQVKALAAHHMRGRQSWNVDADGNLIGTVRRTAQNVEDAAGSRGATPLTPDVLTDMADRYREGAEADGMQNLGAIVQFGGLEQDELTGATRSLAILGETAGVPTRVSIPAGAEFVVPASEITENPMLGFFRNLGPVEDEPTLVRLQAPSPANTGSAEQRTVGAQEFMLYDPATGAWEPRAAILQEDEPRLTLEQVIARREREEAEPGLLDRTGFNPPDSAITGRGESAITNEPVGAGLAKVKTAIMDVFRARRGSQGQAQAPVVSADTDVVELAQQEQDAAIGRGEFLRDLDADTTFYEDLGTFLEESEGRATFAYDDHTGKRLKPGQVARGDATIGIGFNLTRPDADEMIRRVGGNPTEVAAGREGLSRAQQNQLLQAAVRKDVQWLRRRFKDVQMPAHRWQALLSLMYNSRWNANGPTLIGPKITAAIRAGDWEAAAQEIEFNSQGGVPDHLLNGIRSRRRREAQLFRGQ